MQLIDYDVPQIFEQPRPACVMRQNSRVQHVRVRQDNVPLFPNRFSRIVRRVAVVCKHAKRPAPGLLRRPCWDLALLQWPFLASELFAFLRRGFEPLTHVI